MELQGSPRGTEALRDGLSAGVTALHTQGSTQSLGVGEEPLEMKRCHHLELVVVDMHVYCCCANNKLGCNATVENSQREVGEKSY